MRTKGFTVLELLITVGITSILSAVLVPNVVNARKQSHYTAASALLRSLAQEIMMCSLETSFSDGGYPADAAPNAAPEGCPNVDWPTDIPFNSTIDYENWDLGNGERWIGLTFWGEENNRSGIPTNTDLGNGLIKHKTADNITISLTVSF